MNDTSEELRLGLQRVWNDIAPHWDAQVEYAETRSAAVTATLLSAARLGPGDRVLELAAGTGGVGLAAAPLVAPQGSVVITDVAPGMTAIARRRAADVRWAQLIEVRERDLEAIDEPDRAFDAVLCREGVMLVPDPERAAAEMRRVLRPRGHAVATVWSAPARNPWLGVLLDAVGTELGVPMPPPGVPGPFSLGDADDLAALWRGAGFDQVVVRPLPLPLRAASAEDWWTRTSALAGPLAALLAGMPAEQATAIRVRACRTIAVYETADGSLDVPGECLMVTGRA